MHFTSLVFRYQGRNHLSGCSELIYEVWRANEVKNNEGKEGENGIEKKQQPEQQKSSEPHTDHVKIMKMAFDDMHRNKQKN